MGLKHKKISASARNLMLQHRWPGNVRELLNTLQRATVWSDDEVIGLEAMKDAILVPPKGQRGASDILDRPIEGGVPLDALMAEIARHYLKRALEHTHSNKSQAADLLGLGSYQTLTNWMNRYGIDA